MPAGDIETFRQDDTWHNRIEGQTGATHHAYDSKDEAVDAGRKLAQDAMVEHVVKNLDGTVGERNSYGIDPRNAPTA